MNKLLIAVCLYSSIASAQTTSWENSPYNWDNSQYNYNSRTGVYTNSGDRIGYETISPSGVRNYYDNDGNRRAYSR